MSRELLRAPSHLSRTRAGAACARPHPDSPCFVTACPAPLPLLVAAEFTKIAIATSFGFAIMGFIGFFVKLIFIPINNIIVGLN